jgi:hypothetical protein
MGQPQASYTRLDTLAATGIIWAHLETVFINETQFPLHERPGN